MKTLSIISTLLVTLAFTSPIPAHALSFTYSFIARSADQTILSLDPDQPPVLSHTDALKIFLKPGDNTYLYLFLHDAEGGLYLLFPEKISDMECCYTMNKPYYYPPADDWAGFGETGGTEQFIILASGTRLKKLEELTAAYMEKLALHWKAPEDTRAQQTMTTARHGLLEQIRKIRLEHSDFTNSKEELTVIAGEFRDAADEVTGNLVTAGKFYGKTIRIEHKPPPAERDK